MKPKPTNFGMGTPMAEPKDVMAVVNQLIKSGVLSKGSATNQRTMQQAISDAMKNKKSKM